MSKTGWHIPIPNVLNYENFIRKQKNLVFNLLRVFALIYPYREKALFVQQALNAYLSMMGEIENAVQAWTHNE